jgi:hypothetical protein
MPAAVQSVPQNGPQPSRACDSAEIEVVDNKVGVAGPRKPPSASATSTSAGIESLATQQSGSAPVGQVAPSGASASSGRPDSKSRGRTP